MNHETLASVYRALGASIYEPFAKLDAKTMAPAAFRIEALNKCNPLAGINITPELVRMCNRLKDIVPAALPAQMEQHSKLAKLLDSTLRGPPRR